MDMDFPGGKAGGRCGRLEIHGHISSRVDGARNLFIGERSFKRGVGDIRIDM
jgi:hypothetical protein